ncbi:MAG: class I SAM-dependent methyltransferase [Rhizobiales bacterium]|nr:class I SAM-dependent methyltransferase [Hyphomicrobiales bacterium]NRB14046.1 class I SAM-dependent methyltransferase [Hyphomicrobiales bacterium]
MNDAKSKFSGNADAYNNYMGRWSQKIAPLFLDWLNADLDKRWLDIGCGTAELSTAIVEKTQPKDLAGVDQSSAYIEYSQNKISSGNFWVGDALDLKLADALLDYAVSGLVLNFMPDQAKAIAEMKRVLRIGGTGALYVWDYAGQMQIMRYFFDVARQFDDGGDEFDDGIKALICNPKPLKLAFEKAGFNDVEVVALDITTAFKNFDDYWQPFTSGTGSAPKYCNSLSDETREKIKTKLMSILPTSPDGEILLAARVWAVKGVA